MRSLIRFTGGLLTTVYRGCLPQFQGATANPVAQTFVDSNNNAVTLNGPTHLAFANFRPFQAATENSYLFVTCKNEHKLRRHECPCSLRPR